MVVALPSSSVSVSRDSYRLTIVVPHDVDVAKVQSIDVFEHRIEVRVGESKHQQKNMLHGVALV